MKAPKLVKTKKSQLKVPVTTAGRKMQFYRNSNRSGCNIYYKLLLKNQPLASSSSLVVYKFGPFYVIPRPDRFFSVIYKRLQNPQSHSRKAAN